MENITIKTPVKAPVEVIKNGFNEDLFKALKPPFVPMKVLQFDGCEKGDKVHVQLAPGLHWISLIEEHFQDEGQWYFIDVGTTMPFPLKEWRHIHKVIKTESGSIIIDDINFSCGSSITDKIMRPIIKQQFLGRPEIYQKIFGRN